MFGRSKERAQGYGQGQKALHGQEAQQSPEAYLPYVDIAERAPEITEHVEEFVAFAHEAREHFKQQEPSSGEEEPEYGDKMAELRQQEVNALNNFVLGELVESIWGEQPESVIDRGRYIYSRVEGARVNSRIVLGYDALSRSKNTRVENSVVCGRNALSSRRPFPAIRSAEELRSVAQEIVDHEGRTQVGEDHEADSVSHEEIYQVAQTILDSLGDGPDLYEESTDQQTGKALKELPEKHAKYIRQAENPHNLPSAKMRNVVGRLRAHGFTYNPYVGNSIILGGDAMKEAIGGKIENSVIGGDNPLEDAIGVHIRNSYIIRYEGDEVQVRYIEDERYTDWERFRK